MITKWVVHRALFACESAAISRFPWQTDYTSKHKQSFFGEDTDLILSDAINENP